MTTKPILFNTAMVQGILEDRKTQTRRIQGLKKVNEILNGDPHNYSFSNWKEGKLYICFADRELLITPKYLKGDILWVRETFIPPLTFGTVPGYIYKSDYPDLKGAKWKPSIFMPKAACRIFLEVTKVRVERLQDISEEDAIAEGIERYNNRELLDYRSYAVKKGTELLGGVYPYASFKTLWQSINGKESWKENPWVWVYDFKRVEKPENFK